MFQFCMFGGHDGSLADEPRKIYITLFGGSELRVGTLASQIAAARNGGYERRYFFFTMCGGTSLKLPTLSEEFNDLMDALRIGVLNLDEWDRIAGQIAAHNRIYIGSFTLFGGFDGAELPNEDVELDRLALSFQLGQINDAARKVLMSGIGQSGPQRAATVRQAVAAGLMGSRA
jgi:hypothetical protein